ncbi:hypothetical protein [Rufibacter roseus]|uniref:DUF4168 domain-containing protein n=1 Tax=Rufibacter roseus TaxID=1567108 RepID=A0ABW2DNY2_9BACT|nr:hypothetical protein [Rufibacter roseus]
MKNFTLTLYFLLALAVSAVAQNTPQNPAMEKATTDLTRLMAESMALNEVDYIKLKAINTERLTLTTEVEKLYADDEVMLNSRLQEIEEEYEEKVFKILNSRQVAAYAEFKQRPEANFTTLTQKIKGQ